MRVFKATYRDRQGRTRESARWYVEIRDHLETVRRMRGFTDRKVSEEFGRNVERLVDCRRGGVAPDAALMRWVESLPPAQHDRLTALGLLNPDRVAAGKPLSEHLHDFAKFLRDRGNTEKHVRLVSMRAQKAIEGCGFVQWTDITADKVMAYLDALRAGGEGIGAQTFNFYLQAVKQFCRFMVKTRRASESPLVGVEGLNVRTDRRHDRRALTVDELRRLLDVTRNGAKHHGMTGPERAMLYKLAVETGLRAGELRSLTKASFHLDTARPSVTVSAAYSKNRTEADIPLKADMAEELRPFLASRLPNAPAFSVPQKAYEMFRTDLEAGGIPYVDEAGRVADFHSLRHTFITNLVTSGVNPKVAQALARHSDIKLTMDRYTHLLLDEKRKGLDALPDLSSAPESRAATGTDGRGVLAFCLASEGRESDIPGDQVRQTETEGQVRPEGVQTAGEGVLAGVEGGTPGAIRTRDLRFRKPPLYPTELRAQPRGQSSECTTQGRTDRR